MRGFFQPAEKNYQEIVVYTKDNSIIGARQYKPVIV